jgi:hypothetical protein
MQKVLPILLLLIASPVISAAQSRTPTVDDPDAYAIYNQIIARQWPVRVTKARRLVIEVETTDWQYYNGKKLENLCLKPTPGEEGTIGLMRQAFEEANKQVPLLQRKFTIPYEYELVSRESITALLKGKGEEGWKDFYVKYPDSGGSIHLSAVGFNADKTLALVYVGYWCGDICGEGAYYYLKKTDGKWSDIRWPGIQCHWIS